MIEIPPALRSLLPTRAQPAAMPTTRSAAARAGGTSKQATEPPGDALDIVAATTKARTSRRGTAAATAASAGASADAAKEAPQQAGTEAPPAKRQRKATTLPKLEGPPCFSAATSLVRVGTSGKDARQLWRPLHTFWSAHATPTTSCSLPLIRHRCPHDAGRLAIPALARPRRLLCWPAAAAGVGAVCPRV